MMIWRWRYFIGAALVVGYLLVTHGAPPMAVLAGLAGAAMYMRRRLSKPA